MNLLKQLSRQLTMLIVVGFLSLAAWADGTVNWGGNGTQDGQLQNIQCDTDNPPGTMLWILTLGGSNTVTSATLTVNGTEYNGTKSGAQFHFSTPWYAPDPTNTTASASYVGAPGSGSLVLTISHGCPPVQEGNLWCSPGFWKNSADAAWSETGYQKTDYYNTTAGALSGCPTFPNNPSLYDVVSNPSTYQGTATNCVARLLTNKLCGGGQLNPDCPACENNCPLNNAGELIPGVCPSD
jgi:hypothetical protein